MRLAELVGTQIPLPHPRNTPHNRAETAHGSLTRSASYIATRSSESIPARPCDSVSAIFRMLHCRNGKNCSLKNVESPSQINHLRLLCSAQSVRTVQKPNQINDLAFCSKKTLNRPIKSMT